ncbi:hypothetical protein HGR00_28845 [Ralstonia insidiosa]|uniref:Toxin VasX N-terminal region domain-containing protein n=2 Tax=Ralstonia insidiosa TaxID=190721 RepID=A0A848P8J1_9RALS|nr:hypothetical protein [Ralstonia insidiosa]
MPKSIKPGLPDWAGGDRVRSVSLGDDFHYVLRTLRTGYLYLFYDKNARGPKQWECYAVGDDGSLTRQLTPQSAQPQSTPVLQCSRHGANNTQVHYLVIEHPEKCGATWIAYSEHKWSDETIAAYEANSKLRNKRMQTIQPAAMAAGAKHSHGQIAAKAALESVLEYAQARSVEPLPFNPPVSTLSNENGTCIRDGQFEQMSTRYPWYLRTGMAESTVKHMENRGKGEDKPSKPHVLALWDAMGIAHELNGFRNDAAGWIKKYGDERALQISALNLYDGLKSVLEDSAQIRGEEYIRRGAEDGPLQEGIRELEEKLKSSPDDEYLQKQLAQLKSLQAAMAAAAPKVGEAYGKSQAAAAWPKYQDRIDDSAKTFTTNLNKFQEKVAGIVDRRTQSLIHWLEAPLLLDTLNDYHGENVGDGLLFEQHIGEAVFGIGSCKTGAEKIAAWVKQCEASNESNLLWRTVALNQDKAREELDAKLAEAKQHKSSETLASKIAWVGYTAKGLKAFADTYKKAQSVYDANTKANSTAGSKAFDVKIKAVNMRGVDKAAITFGDAVFKYFRIDKLGDYASEKIIQHIFSIRALVNAMDSEDLIAKQVAAEKASREQAAAEKAGREQAAPRTPKAPTTEAPTKTANTPNVPSKRAQELKDAWAKFKVSDDAKAPQAIKDARLAVVVMLIEGVNFSKLIADCKAKKDMKSYLSLLASGMSITSALLDIATIPVKNLPGMGAETWGYQVLKGWGGVLSGVASAIGGGLDVSDSIKNFGKGYDRLAYFYLFKGGVGIGSGVLTWAVTYTYAAPLVARLTGRAAAGAAVEAIGARAAAFIGLRILGMAVGGWITVGLFGLQVVIWVITPNAIEDWVDHSAFGKERKTGGYRTAKEQDEKLSAALVEMGFK